MQPPACIALILSLATVVTASPHPLAPSIIKRGEEEVHVFRRDTPLTPNDLVIAENYGVNTTESTYSTPITLRYSSLTSSSVQALSD